ncbi:MAG TPA: prephenate dehydratase domain-containing protein, partial [Actinomycetaceae bacterium]|nr:prephenate dehydratase domain-containing protein [Actinomycetaceae bacterium]
LPGTTAGDIREIATHPHAWAQCRGWVARQLGEVAHRPATSTAAAAAELAAAGSRAEAGYDAVLCSELSAERYELETFAQGVADNRGAVTRFIVVTQDGEIPAPTGADKTTLMVHLPHNEAGALLSMLDQFAVRGVNLSRIESRPIGDSLGRYSFSIDVEGHVAEERVAETLVGLHRVCPIVRFLGSYPRADRAMPVIARGASEQDFLAAREWVAGLRGAVGGNGADSN